MPTTATGVNVAPLGPLLIVLLVVAAACGGSSRAEMSPEAETWPQDRQHERVLRRATGPTAKAESARSWSVCTART